MVRFTFNRIVRDGIRYNNIPWTSLHFTARHRSQIAGNGSSPPLSSRVAYLLAVRLAVNTCRYNQNTRAWLFVQLPLLITWEAPPFLCWDELSGILLLGVGRRRVWDCTWFSSPFGPHCGFLEHFSNYPGRLCRLIRSRHSISKASINCPHRTYFFLIQQQKRYLFRMSSLLQTWNLSFPFSSIVASMILFGARIYLLTPQFVSTEGRSYSYVTLRSPSCESEFGRPDWLTDSLRGLDIYRWVPFMYIRAN